MPTTEGFGKLRRVRMSADRLPMVLREAVRNFKQQVRAGAMPTVFQNHGRVLPPAKAGQTYDEYDVGQATVPSPRDPNGRGRFRLVGLVDAGGSILKIYFTMDHYAAGSWQQLQYP